MNRDLVTRFAEISLDKANLLGRSIIKYMILSMLAGIYVGFGVVLAFSVGAPYFAAGAPGVRAIMGASFGLALTLVVFAGSELFTGNNLVMTMGTLTGKVTLKTAVQISLTSYAGNFLGSMLLALAMRGTGLITLSPLRDLILLISSEKMNAPFIELFSRGVLCNMLVCLAIWTSSRAKEDISRIILIFWCLFGFVGAGFEHCIANMSLLGMSLLIPHDPALISLSGFAYNLLVVTMGNIIGGALFIGAAYWYVSKDWDTGHTLAFIPYHKPVYAKIQSTPSIQSVVVLSRTNQ